jgi:integrase
VVRRTAILRHIGPRLRTRRASISGVRRIEIVRRMTVFPTAADCLRLVAFDSQDPEGIQFDAALSLLYGTGCLPSEVSLLKVQDIQRPDGRTVVSFSSGGSRAPEGRKVDLSGRVKSIIDRHLDRMIAGGTEHPIFVSSRSGRFNGAILNDELARRCAVLGFPDVLTTTSLRRACVRHCLERGMPPDQLCGLLGLRDANSVVALGR